MKLLNASSYKSFLRDEVPEQGWPSFAQFSCGKFTDIFQSPLEKLRVLRAKQYDKQNLDSFGNKIISRINLKVWLITQHISLRCDSFRYRLVSSRVKYYKNQIKPKSRGDGKGRGQKGQKSKKQTKFQRN